MDKRFKKINALLTSYSQGNFNRRLDVSSRLDEIDAFIAGINMLGEELKTTTISRDYFNNIFHSVSDMVFVLNGGGKLTDINQSVTDRLGYALPQVAGRGIDHFLFTGQSSLLHLLNQQLRGGKELLNRTTVFRTTAGSPLPVLVTAGPLQWKGKRKPGFLVTAKDRTSQLQTENLIIRTIIDTQEKERRRLAKDLHDSLGQQLSAIKFYIGATLSNTRNEAQRTILLKSSEALTRIQADMRSICFALMPKTLEEFGLRQAVSELCSQLEHTHPLRFTISYDSSFGGLSKELEIDIYRVIQEFITNAITHGKADKITIRFLHEQGGIKITLRDNGRGFTPAALKTQGIGLHNIRSRVASHNGELKLVSAPGKGTKYIVSLPRKVLLL